MKVDDKTERIEVTMLVACGMAAFVVDVFIDVWMYATLGGLAGNLVAHAIVFAGFVAACAWKRYGYKWLWPAILEFGFVGGMYFADPATYVPYLTAFMGLTISWLFMVIGSGYGPQETRGKLDKVISQIL